MWIMSSKRHRGVNGLAPYVEFRIGNVPIARITMRSRGKLLPWVFSLELGEDIPTRHFTSFGEALSQLHEDLKSPSPADFET